MNVDKNIQRTSEYMTADRCEKPWSVSGNYRKAGKDKNIENIMSRTTGVPVI